MHRQVIPLKRPWAGILEESDIVLVLQEDWQWWLGASLLVCFLGLGRVSMTQPFGHELALQTNTTILLCMSVAPTASIGSSIQRLGRTRQSTHST